jgi:hypothetical protein
MSENETTKFPARGFHVRTPAALTQRTMFLIALRKATLRARVMKIVLASSLPC